MEDWVSSDDEIDRILNSQPDSNSMNVTGDASKHIDPATYDITLKEGRSTPILLVHGVFGAGKSYLVVVLIIFIREYIVKRYKETVSESPSSSSVSTSPIQDIRIMIAAATNVAVDGLLKTLLKNGFTDFARVGRRERIAPEVRKHEHKGGSAITKSVVGITCASVYNKASIMATLSNIGCFDVLFLDECSQMIEPQSLLPIFASKCSRMILVGDPMQLPPVVKRSMSRSRSASSEVHRQNLSRK